MPARSRKSPALRGFFCLPSGTRPGTWETAAIDNGRMELLATALHDIGICFVVVWAGVLLVGGALAELAPLWRRRSTRFDLAGGRYGNSAKAALP